MLCQTDIILHSRLSRKINPKHPVSELQTFQRVKQDVLPSLFFQMQKNFLASLNCPHKGLTSCCNMFAYLFHVHLNFKQLLLSEGSLNSANKFIP